MFDLELGMRGFVFFLIFRLFFLLFNSLVVVAFCVLAFSVQASPLGQWGMSRVLGTYKMIAGDLPPDHMSVPEVRGLQGLEAADTPCGHSSF